ncbi:amidohydrolase [Pseudonocardia sp. TRM90224]|uniref:amidohydrolase n=1 Tax=Pseudonocardia sp. TRM90224 TaxID=2812678 RepID=UPI001E289E43|nr:amidohydrolase [Pseudonocardia sp. TRM90224]
MRAVYVGARVFTAGEPAWADAIAVVGERIAYVGDEVGAREAAGSGAEIVELDGGVVLPGFVDGHAHLLMSGAAELRANLHGAPDMPEIARRIRAWADEHLDAPRVLGQGWSFSAVPDGRPARQLLDSIVPDRPAYLDAADYHSVWVNTAALRELGVTAATPDPVGGVIVRDASGEATGHLVETAGLELVWPFLAGIATDADRDAHLAAAMAAYSGCGVTGAVEMALDGDGLAAMARAERAGASTVRVAAHWLVPRGGSAADHLAQVAEAAALAERHRSPWLRVTGVKLIVDGVIDGCTAALSEPYANGNNAEPIWDLDALAPVVAAADAAGLQVAMHAIGDKAVRIALDALEHAAERNGPRPRRHRIEHLEYTDPADVPRLARLGVTASVQPVHADPAIQDNWRAMLGDSRVDRGFPWPEFVDAGATLALGTDTPTAHYHPLRNMYVAATRRSAIDPALPPNVPRYALPLVDAIRHATADAAWSCRAADQGRLVVGMLADLVVLDRDPFTEGPQALLDARVLRTVVGGQETGGGLVG